MKRLPTPMFQASVIIRGSQIAPLGEASDRVHTMSETRPTWDMASRVQRPTKRRRSRVCASMLSEFDGALGRPDVSSPPMARKSTAPSARAGRREFRRRLLRWFRRHGRDLPWRRTRDPYHVIVSEFMLQQTQVSRVEAYYHRFLARYPTIHALAAAPAAMVRESWDGLGYYRRAANLHRLAQEVVRDHAGVIPSDPGALQQTAGRGALHGGGGGQLCLRALARQRWTRTWRG